MRAEPIWNWDSNKFPGLSGFNFRFFTGVRLAINKPSYYSTIQNILQETKPDKNSQKQKNEIAPQAVPNELMLPVHPNSEQSTTSTQQLNSPDTSEPDSLPLH
jgi:hypothetical protein